MQFPDTTAYQQTFYSVLLELQGRTLLPRTDFVFDYVLLVILKLSRVGIPYSDERHAFILNITNCKYKKLRGEIRGFPD